jgi:hypothetical protein
MIATCPFPMAVKASSSMMPSLLMMADREEGIYPSSAFSQSAPQTDQGLTLPPKIQSCDSWTFNNHGTKRPAVEIDDLFQDSKYAGEKKAVRYTDSWSQPTSVYDGCVGFDSAPRKKMKVTPDQSSEGQMSTLHTEKSTLLNKECFEQSQSLRGQLESDGGMVSSLLEDIEDAMTEFEKEMLQTTDRVVGNLPVEAVTEQSSQTPSSCVKPDHTPEDKVNRAKELNHEDSAKILAEIHTLGEAEQLENGSIDYLFEDEMADSREEKLGSCFSKTLDAQSSKDISNCISTEPLEGACLPGNGCSTANQVPTILPDNTGNPGSNAEEFKATKWGARDDIQATNNFQHSSACDGNSLALPPLGKASRGVDIGASISSCGSGSNAEIQEINIDDELMQPFAGMDNDVIFGPFATLSAGHHDSAIENMGRGQHFTDASNVDHIINGIPLPSDSAESPLQELLRESIESVDPIYAAFNEHNMRILAGGDESFAAARQHLWASGAFMSSVQNTRARISQTSTPGITSRRSPLGSAPRPQTSFPKRPSRPSVLLSFLMELASPSQRPEILASIQTLRDKTSAHVVPVELRALFEQLRTKITTDSAFQNSAIAYILSLGTEDEESSKSINPQDPCRSLLTYDAALEDLFLESSVRRDLRGYTDTRLRKEYHRVEAKLSTATKAWKKYRDQRNHLKFQLEAQQREIERLRAQISRPAPIVVQPPAPPPYSYGNPVTHYQSPYSQPEAVVATPATVSPSVTPGPPPAYGSADPACRRRTSVLRTESHTERSEMERRNMTAGRESGEIRRTWQGQREEESEVIDLTGEEDELGDDLEKELEAALEAEMGVGVEDGQGG